jgi:hypothetical protein
LNYNTNGSNRCTHLLLTAVTSHPRGCPCCCCCCCCVRLHVCRCS